MTRVSIVVLALALLAGCSNPVHYFRLEETGEGWQLQVEEKGRSFRASWVKGDHRSGKLVNYHEAPNGTHIVVNTLYLEMDDAGRVVRGMLKRVVTPELSRASYYERVAERNAVWWAVTGGTCLLDKDGNGKVDVTCKGGYSFTGDVVADDKLKVIKPE